MTIVVFAPTTDVLIIDVFPVHGMLSGGRLVVKIVGVSVQMYKIYSLYTCKLVTKW